MPCRLDFVLEVPDVSVGLLAHPATIQQVLLNLVLNAVEAIGDRDGHIRVTLALVGDSWISLDVQDDGCGMDESQLATLFVPFLTTKSGGRGLGLSSVQETVSILPGARSRCRAERAKERTSESCCRASPKASRLPNPGASTSRFRARERDERCCSSKTIPLSGKSWLLSWGVRVTRPFTAATAANARELIDKVGGFWLALVDASLGEDDGLAVMEMIRERLPKAKVVLMRGGRATTASTS